MSSRIRSHKMLYMWAAFLVCVLVIPNIGAATRRRSSVKPLRLYGDFIDHTWEKSLGRVIIMRDARGQVRHFPLKPGAQVQLDGVENRDWDMALVRWQEMPDRYPDVCLDFRPDGSVKTVNILGASDAGILMRATKRDIWIRTDPQHNGGIWGSYEQMDYACPGWEIDPAMLSLSQVRRIRISKRTRFSFNLDPVDSATIRRSKGVYVFVFFDRFGSAKYVDAVRVHEWWYTGESGFEVIQPSKKNEPRHLVDVATKKRYSLAPNVKVYSRSGRIPIESFRGPLVREFLNATRDSKKGWITHVFLTEALE